MFSYVTTNEFIINFVFPFIIEISSLFLTYHIFEPRLIKKNLTNIDT